MSCDIVTIFTDDESSRLLRGELKRQFLGLKYLDCCTLHREIYALPAFTATSARFREYLNPQSSKHNIFHHLDTDTVCSIIKLPIFAFLLLVAFLLWKSS